MRWWTVARCPSSGSGTRRSRFLDADDLRLDALLLQLVLQAVGFIAARERADADLAQAEELLKVVEKTGVVFAVSHNYTGHPLVRQAREMVLNGELGEINAIRAFYIQGWLQGGTLPEKSAKRIFGAADRIMKAGQPVQH